MNLRRLESAMLGSFSHHQSRPRDKQRSLVYAWEVKASGGTVHQGVWKSLEEVEAFLQPIWRAERGRVGLAKQRAPTLSRNLWGQRRASASDDHEIKLPRAMRNPWIVARDSSPTKSDAESSVIVASLPFCETTVTLARPFCR